MLNQKYHKQEFDDTHLVNLVATYARRPQTSVGWDDRQTLQHRPLIAADDGSARLKNAAQHVKAVGKRWRRPETFAFAGDSCCVDCVDGSPDLAVDRLVEPVTRQATLRLQKPEGALGDQQACQLKMIWLILSKYNSTMSRLRESKNFTGVVTGDWAIRSNVFLTQLLVAVLESRLPQTDKDVGQPCCRQWWFQERNDTIQDHRKTFSSGGRISAEARQQKAANRFQLTVELKPNNCCIAQTMS